MAVAQAEATDGLPSFTDAQQRFDELHVPDVPLPNPGQIDRVSLDAILAYADQNAPGLQVARARLGLGDAALAGAEPLLPENPTLQLNVGPALNAAGNHVDFIASLSQRIEIAGERGLRIDAAEQTRKRLRAELDEARWEVHRDVHAAFHRALVARERLQAAERLLRFQERLLHIAQRRLQAGDISPLPVRLSAGELSQAKVAHITATQRYRQARLTLGNLAGWPHSHPPKPAGTLDAPRDAPSYAALVDVARTHQPRLRTLHRRRAEARAQRRSADREAWPKPTLGVKVNRESFRQGPPETKIFGTIAIPIPLARRNQGARAEAQAQEEVASAEQAAFFARLSNLIEQHRTAVEAAAARLRAYGQEILPTFEENLRLLQRAFELGEIDILQVSVARERFLRIQTDALDAYVDYFQAVADLEAAIGADLWPEERHEHAAHNEAPP